MSRAAHRAVLAAEPMTPGDYIRARRKHFGMKNWEVSVAAELAPGRLSEIERGADPLPWEADAIGAVIHDDFDVLTDLIAGREIRLCRGCGCHEHDACLNGFNEPCSWVDADLCSHCADPRHAIGAVLLGGFDAEARAYVRKAA